MFCFQGKTADAAWLNAAAHFGGMDPALVQISRAGGTRELLGAVFEIENPRQRWVSSRKPALNPAFAIAEVVWILAGRRDSAFINHWNPKLSDFAGNGKRYHGAYGYRLRNQFGFDQLERAYHALSANPDSRQVVLQIWDASTDMPIKDGTPAASDIPCNVCSILKLRAGRLEWTQILRSNDLFLGVPHNFVQFTSLQEILAGWLGVEVGTYRHYADCLHVYTRDLDSLADVAPTEVVENPDEIRLSKPDCDKAFKELAARMDAMTRSSISEKSFRRLVFEIALPEPLQNWLRIVAADASRRRRWHDVSGALLGECSNPALEHLWAEWEKRWRRRPFPEIAEESPEAYAQSYLPLRFA